ncbi:phage protein Gp27 family protein [Sphingomonas sp. CROZ-RG-20F-R02-07]|uniref:phage protein Gp27 family protein n=1 Tax=Sphingomonas sp. CROZ-RG-20F-R02-07 TaxID=2914832 RepID=UPI001F575C52|nr:phage protein Gp27 family protein [Sphingomonas sp. CROZ-RG-20F-R02-07]
MTDDRRQGRGRLSSLDLMPEEAEADIVWALEQLRERAMPQNAILDEFNARIADRGIAKVSKSAFSRWSVRKAIQFRRLDEVRAITSDVVTGLGTDGADQVTVAVAEMLKVAIYESLEGQLDPKSIMELSRALGSAVAAQKTSADHRRKLEEQVNAKVEAAAETATASAREAGLSADRVAQIRRDVLGVRT